MTTYIQYQRGRSRREWHSFRRRSDLLPGDAAFHSAYVGLGSSLGNRAAHLRQALERLDDIPQGTFLQAVSPVYETPHMGLEPGDDTRFPPHFNCVAQILTRCSPIELLVCIQKIEAQGGRRREVRWGPRTIDIDILLYDDVLMHTEALILPHPGLTSRIFVARPLLDVAPDLALPDGRRLADILEPGSNPIFNTDDERHNEQHLETVASDKGAAALRAQAIRRVEPHELLV